MDGLLLHLEQLAARVSDDGWKHLSNDVIASIHRFPPEWTSVMRRMAMAYEHICRAARGNIPVEDEYSEEDDDIDQLMRWGVDDPCSRGKVRRPSACSINKFDVPV